MKEVLPTLKKSEPKFRSFFSRSGSSVADSVSALIESSVDFDVSVEKCSSGPEPKSVARSISVNDPLFYIYTSGTTGLPKAVIIKHIRQLFVGIAAIYTCGFRRDDVIYCHLPLYHSSGSQLGTAPAFFYGATTIIKRKFSASQFWSDCIKYDVTASIAWCSPIEQASQDMTHDFLAGYPVHWRDLSLSSEQSAQSRGASTSCSLGLRQRTPGPDLEGVCDKVLDSTARPTAARRALHIPAGSTLRTWPSSTEPLRAIPAY